MAMIGIVPEVLNEENYGHWKTCLKSYLVGHGLWGVVSGKEERPPKEEDPAAHEEWKRKNALALHAIQLSCGSGLYAKFKKETHVSARYAWYHIAEKSVRPSHIPHPDQDQSEDSTLEQDDSTEHHHHEELYKAVERGDWHAAKAYIQRNPNAIRERISSHKGTALHIAILAGHLKTGEELVKLMEAEDLELTNEFGATVLHLAAVSGTTRLARKIVDKNPKLVTMKNEHDDGLLPVIVASMYGRRHMVRYLYRKTPKWELSPEKGTDGATLLNSLITAEIYDVASMLLERHKHLGVMEDHYGKTTLRILAHKPSAFPSGNKFALWQRLIYKCVRVSTPWDREKDQHLSESNINSATADRRVIQIHDSTDEDIPGKQEKRSSFQRNMTHKVRWTLRELGWRILRCLGKFDIKFPDIKHIHDRKLVHAESVELLSHIFVELGTLRKSELAKMEIDKAIHDAIKFGIVEFIEEILKYSPEIMWRTDNKGRTIFAQAIVFRQEKIFSLIYKFGTRKSIMARRQDIFGNNFLHLAAKLSPPAQLEKVSGAALQMQRELQWFKEVESIIQPKCKEEVNEYHKTPAALFIEQHKELAREGERWMKNTAGSSMVVGTLIAAVMFTTAFTVPGGNDQTHGLPIMLKENPRGFMVFMASNAISMFTSSTSVLMFLGILTARYAEEDFYKSLPTKLIFGLACLFLSIVTMMISFGSSVYLILHSRVRWVSIPIIVCSIIPVTLFSALQFPLLCEMIVRTYGYGIFDKQRKKQPH